MSVVPAVVARACAWTARDTLAALVTAVWGAYVVTRGGDYPDTSPLEWLGGLGIVLGVVSRFYAQPAPAAEEGGL